MTYVYVIRNELNGEEFYVGVTNDLERRLKDHNTSRNRSTRGGQWRIVYYEAYLTLGAARRREHRLKHGGKARKALLERIKMDLE